MTITKTKEEIDRKRQIREKANEGCDRCPCCGSWDVSNYDLREILIHRALFRFDTYYIDCFRCDHCGAEWEGEPYER